jgi:hypothetical protein
MKVILITALLLSYIRTGFCQSKDTSAIALQTYLAKHIRYPAVARENEVKGQSYISFKLNEDGTIANMKFLKALGLGCEESIKKALESFKGTLSIKPREYSFSVSFIEPTGDTVIKDDAKVIAEAKKNLKEYLFNVDVVGSPIKTRTVIVY